MTEAPRRRRRVRSADSSSDATSTDPAADPTGDAVTEGGDYATAHTSAVLDEPAVWIADVVEPDTLPAERGLRGLVGGGSSQVSPTAALRARDAARPRPEDLARADADLAIIRRNWSPRE